MPVDHTTPMMMQAGTKGLVNVEGFICTREFYDFVAAMKDYDDNLELACLNPDMAELGDEPFVILERCTDGNLRKVFGVWEINESVLDRIRMCDGNRHDILAMIDKENAARERETLRRYKDRSEENKAIVESAIRNMGEREKSKYTFTDKDTGEKVTIHADKPSERKGS